MKRVLGLLIVGLILIGGCSGYSGPPVATPTPVPWIDKCPDPVYRISRGEDYPDEIPTIFYESYPNLGSNWNDQARRILVFKGSSIRIFRDEYIPGVFEENFADVWAEDEDYSYQAFGKNDRVDIDDYWIRGVSAVMIRKCPDPSISPSPS